MKKFLVVVVVILLGWYGNYRYYKQQHTQEQMFVADDSSQALESNAGSFKCDGRTSCSQMISCAEATFFIRNCPNTKMDGDHDGVPCERQWCN